MTTHKNSGPDWAEPTRGRAAVKGVQRNEPHRDKRSQSQGNAKGQQGQESGLALRDIAVNIPHLLAVRRRDRALSRGLGKGQGNAQIYEPNETLQPKG